MAKQWRSERVKDGSMFDCNQKSLITLSDVHCSISFISFIMWQRGGVN